MTSSIRGLRTTRLTRCLAAALGIMIGNAHGATSVTNCSDDGSPGTLRAILAVAANNAVVDVSGCSKVTLTQGEIPIAVSVTVQGPAQGTTTIDANYLGRVFHSTSTSADLDKLDLVALTVTHGLVSSDYVTAAYGGCILGGEVTLQGSTVTGCIAKAPSAPAEGGAIRADKVTLRNSRVELGAAQSTQGRARGGGVLAASSFKCYDSSISTNEADSLSLGEGGGVAVGLGSALLSGCTIDSNFSQYAGGLLQSGAQSDSVTISNSTISSNLATISNGGVFTHSALTMKNSTVAYNFAAEKCGGVRSTTEISIDSSIIASNFSGNPVCVDIVSDGSIIGADNLVSVVNTPVPDGTIVANPRLTPLADHGGPTLTHGLSLNSPAVDHGSNVDSLDSDQRGGAFKRVVGAAADIGSFERQADDDVLFYGGAN